MLVSDLLKVVLPRLGRQASASGITIYQAANSIQSLIYKNLLRSKSDLIASGELDLYIPAFGRSATLPSDFESMAERPKSVEQTDEWMAGAVQSYDNDTGELVVNVATSSGTDTLSVWFIALAGVPGMPAQNIGNSTSTLTVGTGIQTITTQAGLNLLPGYYVIVSSENSPPNWEGRKRLLQPNYLGDGQGEHTDEWWMNYSYWGESFQYPTVRPSTYKIIGNTMIIKPECVVDINVTGKYNQRLVDLTIPSQVIPWDGRFDEIFKEGVIRIIAKGTAVVEDDLGFMALFKREFDSVMISRGRLIPTQCRTGLDTFM
jgi:hypothetical protein